MTATSALHPQDTVSVSPSGDAMPMFGKKYVVERVPCSGEFDRHEARTYVGMKAADLVDHAKDIEAMRLEKPLGMGSTERFRARASEFTDGILLKALSAYLMVKSAMRLMMRPLQNRVRREPSHNKMPVAPKAWVTPAPTQAEWDARDATAGYDIRGTSPTWILRRAYRHRVKRRLALEPPLERAYRLGHKASKTNTEDFIGPLRPMHYKEVEDLHQVWPPVELPKGPKGMLPLLVQKTTDVTEPVIPKTQSDIRDPGKDENPQDAAELAHINGLIDGYNFALEQFGADSTCNYLQSLGSQDEALMNGMINRQREQERARNPKNKEPP